MNITQEQMKKAMGCKSVDELLALARAEGLNLTAEEAAKYFASLTDKNVDLNELEAVNGGACAGNLCGVDC